MAYSGKWVPSDLKKYRGDHTKITYRSNWEKFFFTYCDKNPEIVAWGSETAVIPYFSNADGKKRRYFMDIWMKDSTGQEFFIEIKPKKETQPPVKPVNLTTGAKKRYMNEIYTYSVNCDKWKAASALAEKRNIKFRVLTEDGLRRLGYKG